MATERIDQQKADASVNGSAKPDGCGRPLDGKTALEAALSRGEPARPATGGEDGVRGAAAAVASTEEFKQGMRHLAAAVNVISVMEKNEPRGILATAVCSVCADPPTLLVCLNRNSSTHSSVRNNGRFCVSILDERQHGTAWHFMTSHASERFVDGEWDTLATGAPAIRSALVNFDCEVDSALDVGTHTIYLGRVIAIRRAGAGFPLMYHDGNYSGLKQELGKIAP